MDSSEVKHVPGAALARIKARCRQRRRLQQGSSPVQRNNRKTHPRSGLSDSVYQTDWMYSLKAFMGDQKQGVSHTAATLFSMVHMQMWELRQPTGKQMEIIWNQFLETLKTLQITERHSRETLEQEIQRIKTFHPEMRKAFRRVAAWIRNHDEALSHSLLLLD